MADFTLNVRRFDPESGNPAYWQEFTVDLEPERSVLDAILRAKYDEDGSLSIRCSCQAAICGSCGVRINGKSKLACNTKLGDAREASQTDNGSIVVEPMGNMPVIKDLIVDMDAVHWKKVQRVTPWLLPEGDPPAREYVVEPQSMIDITQSMACIHCGACVSACLSLEVDPEFIGPAALAKAYRFVGAPRDAHTEDRLLDLAEDPHGIYDCTHCFACVEVCPKDVAPMNQIMRLRRRATGDYGIKDRNNGYGHEKAFTGLIEKYGILSEAQLLPKSYGDGSLIRAQLKPASVKELAAKFPTIVRGLTSGKVSPKTALIHHKLKDQDQIRRIYDEVESHEDRLELNLYIVGEDGSEEAYRAHINEHLEPEGLEYERGGAWWNKNFLWLLVEEIGLDVLRERVVRPLEGLRVGPFYGCYIVRPTRRLGFEFYPDRDKYLEMVIEACGAEPVAYAGSHKCCGFPVITLNRETSLRQAGRHMADALDAGADCVVTPCPLCHLNLDLQQPEAQPFVERDLGMPVLHIPQLVGLALGFAVQSLMLHRNDV